MLRKRILIIAMALLLLAVSAGCVSESPAANNPFEGKTLEDILAALYESTPVGIPSLVMVPITADNETSFLGTTGLNFKEALASEPAISSIAYSVCLVRMNEGEDMEAAKAAVKENVNPAKWVCNFVDESNVIVDSAGDVLILIMTDEFAQSLQASFQEIAKA